MPTFIFRPLKNWKPSWETSWSSCCVTANSLPSWFCAAVLSAAGMNDRGTRTANFYVLRNTEMPAVLVETGYMTNEAECQNLASEAYQQLLAQGIADGVLAYLEAES